MSRFFFGTIAALTLWSPLAAQASPSPSPGASRAHRPAAAHGRAAGASAAPHVADLYSLRFRRHIAAYLRLRLLEWREEGLDRAAAVVERRLSVDSLVPER